MFSMLLPPDPYASRHMEGHPVPPSGGLRESFHDCWGAVLRLLTPTRHQVSHKASLRRTTYLELRTKYLARSRRTRH